MRARWLVVSLVVSSVVLAAASPRVFAQSASVQAQSLFDEGRKLFQAGKLAEACAAFESSQKLDPAITTLLNLADCREQNHQLATAWGTFVDANRMARDKNNDKLARVASNHAKKLEPRLSKLTISVPADHQVAGLEVLRGSDPVNPASWNHALPIDGGTYTITARAPGHAPWSVTKTIKVESDAQAVEIPKLADAKSGPPVAAAHPGGPGTPPPAGASAGTPGGVASSAKPNPSSAAGASPVVTPPAGGSTRSPAGGPAGAAPSRPVTAEPSAAGSRSVADATPAPATPPVAEPATDQPEARHSLALPIAVGAGAVVLGGAALGFDLWGNSKYDQAKQETTDQAKRDALYHSANTRRYLAEASGIAAIGCAGAAVYLYVRHRGDSRTETTAMTPVVSPQFAGLAVAGRW